MRGERDRGRERYQNRSRSPRRRSPDRTDRHRTRDRSPVSIRQQENDMKWRDRSRSRDRDPPRRRGDFGDRGNNGRNRLQQDSHSNYRSETFTTIKAAVLDTRNSYQVGGGGGSTYNVPRIDLSTTSAANNSASTAQNLQENANKQAQVQIANESIVVDPADDDGEMMQDLDLDDDFDDPFAKQRREEEEAARLAEERRKRLAEIKNKYSAEEADATTRRVRQLTIQDMQSSADATSNAKVTADGDDRDDDERDYDRGRKVQRIQLLADENLIDNNQHPAASSTAADGDKNDLVVEDEDENSNFQPMQISREESSATLLLHAEDEGAHLQRERLALQQQEQQEGLKAVYDMFSASPAAMPSLFQQQQQAGRAGQKALRRGQLGHDQHLHGNWDDSDGYYKATIGEALGDRFQVLGVLGKGVFSTVVKCKDLRAPGTPIVAVKLIRNNETMRRAADKERRILLAMKDNKRFCVRLITHLDYRGHVALVFEHQAMNLREALKKFGRDVGINISAVRIYARQLFVALHYLASMKIVHADLKLDNILVSEDLKQVRLCDFGSAFYETDTDNDPTPYLVSRFYRAPEIILGLEYDRAIDLWSVCVCLFELFTGHVMFPGRTNNEMLKLMMEVKSKPPHKVIKAHLRAYEMMSLEPHFDDSMRFRQYETDAVTGKQILRIVDILHPTRNLANILPSAKAGSDDPKLVTSLVDLLENGLAMDPTKRLRVSDALRHPFFTAGTGNQHAASSTSAAAAGAR